MTISDDTINRTIAALQVPLAHLAAFEALSGWLEDPTLDLDDEQEHRIRRALAEC